MRVVIQQVDLDTCLTALLKGVTAADDILVSGAEGATEEDLRDPSCLCIEAGGSGRVSENNFDHHTAEGPRDPACRQALETLPPQPPIVQSLVSYVEAHDLGAACHGPADPLGLTLSALFSGMRLTTVGAQTQLLEGLSILNTVIAEGLNPGELPQRPGWRRWVEAKRAEWEAARCAAAAAEIFNSVNGLRVGFLESDRIGALRELYALDCDMAIAYSPRYRNPAGGDPVRKYTIGGRDGRRVDGLLPALTALEHGWGGPAHGTIIASPRIGSQLTPEQVKSIVRGRHEGQR